MVPRVVEHGERFLEIIGDPAAAVLDGTGRAVAPGSPMTRRGPPVVPIASTGRPCWRASSSSAAAWRGSVSTTTRVGLSPNSATAGESPDGQGHLRADARPEAHLGQRDRQTATANVLAALDEAAGDGLADARLEAPLAVEVERGRAVVGSRAGEPIVVGAGEPGARLTEQQDRLAVDAERRPHERPDVVEQPDDADLAWARSPTRATRCTGETLPPVTGRPSARHASPSPRTPSWSCQNASGRVGSP